LDTSKFKKNLQRENETSAQTPAATHLPPKGLAEAVEDWRKEAAPGVEMKQKRRRRFSALPIKRED